jgi:hypothetical protein
MVRGPYPAAQERERVKHPRQHNPVVVVPIRSVINLVNENIIIEGATT